MQKPVFLAENLSVICLVIVWTLAETAFTSLPLRALWPNRPCFGH